MAVIRSILDNDLYKFTMMRAVLAHCPGVPVRYVFNNRRPEGKFNSDFMDRLYQELANMQTLCLSNEEMDWFGKRCPWLDESYLQYLRNYVYDPNEVCARLVNGDLQLTIEGTWERTILWEVPLMALISELYFETCDTNWQWNEIDYRKNAHTKGYLLQDLRWADFGTRRRRSFVAQQAVVEGMKPWKNFVGTSNVHLAHKYNVRPIGTMAHEWIMGISALEGLRRANRYALRIWSDVFKGDLGIALTDTFGSEAFFNDFDGYLSRLFDGVRHDSGDPYKFADRTIQHYNSLGINPLTRMIVFSDGLNVTEAIKLGKYCEGKIMANFGIGTHFTNDFEGSKALNMVIKLAACNGVNVVKLSDAPSKAIGDRDALRVARHTFFNTPLDEVS